MDELHPVNIRMMRAFEEIFEGQGDPLKAATMWFYQQLRQQRRPQEPTAFANDLLAKALRLTPDEILHLCNDTALASRMEEVAIQRLKKQVMEVVKIRNQLAIMLDRSEVSDPRQITMFSDDNPLSPHDF